VPQRFENITTINNKMASSSGPDTDCNADAASHIPHAAYNLEEERLLVFKRSVESEK
jgi:hypothetical protein